MKIKNILLFAFIWPVFLMSQPITATLKPDSQAGKDAMIGSCVPCNHTNRNFGNRTIMDINTWTFSGNFSQMRSLIEFDYSIIPANAVILSAKLNLYYTGLPENQNGAHSPLNSNNAVAIRRITSSWNEQTVTWNNQPTFTNVGQVMLPHPTSGTQHYTNIDITDFVEFQVVNPAQNFGFMLIQTNNSTHHQLTFASSDHPNQALHPMLEIIYEFPCPIVVNADFNFSVGPNRRVTFTNTSSSTPGVTQYRWNFGDGGLSLSENPIYTYNQDGNYTVCLAVTDTCSTDTICKTISICSAPTLAFTSLQTAPLTYIFASNWPNANAFLWDFGDGNLSTQRNPIYTYANPGSYTVCLTAEDSICGTQTICAPIDPCLQNPLSFGVATISPRTIRLTPSRLQATSYLWDLGDSRTSIVTTPTVTYGLEGNYYICLTVEDSCGIQTTCDSVFVSNTVGLESPMRSKVSVYPNPTRSFVNVEIDGHHNVYYQLVNGLGQSVFQHGAIKEEKLRIDLSTYPRGLYLLLIEIDGESKTFRIVRD
jgi:PKD repeat protein